MNDSLRDYFLILFAIFVGAIAGVLIGKSLEKRQKIEVTFIQDPIFQKNGCNLKVYSINDNEFVLINECERYQIRYSEKFGTFFSSKPLKITKANE